MLVSQAVGVQMIVEGGNTFGAAGALKVPHAVTLHAVQVLPALAILLLAAPELLERRRVAIVTVGAVGYASLIASTMVQTYGGLQPVRPRPALVRTRPPRPRPAGRERRSSRCAASRPARTLPPRACPGSREHRRDRDRG